MPDKTRFVITTFHYAAGVLNHEFISEAIAFLPFPMPSLRVYICVTTHAYISEADMKQIVISQLDAIALLMPHVEFPFTLTGGDNAVLISLELANV